MPEVHFLVRWPGSLRTRCYSPSSTVKQFFDVGREYALAEFLSLSRRALEHAGERVRERYGYACSAAAAEWHRIERIARQYHDTPDAIVVVEEFDE